MPKDIRFYLFTGIVFLAGIGLGFFANNKPAPSQPVIQETKINIDNPLYSSQIANIRGRIDQINGKNLAVTNLNNNISGNVAVSDRIIITIPGNNKPTSDLSVLEAGKEVLIGLEMINGTYQAVTIQYISASPPLLRPALKPATQSSQLQSL